MRWFEKGAAILLFALLGAMASAGVAARDVRFTLPENGALVLSLPDGWHASSKRTRRRGPPTITLSRGDTWQFHVQITPVSDTRGNADFNSPAQVRKSVGNGAPAALRQSVEQELTLQPIGRQGRAGYYFTATDKAPRPGEYLLMTQGAMALDDLLLLFTVLSNPGGEEEASHALWAIENARRERPSP